MSAPVILAIVSLAFLVLFFVGCIWVVWTAQDDPYDRMTSEYRLRERARDGEFTRTTSGWRN